MSSSQPPGRWGYLAIYDTAPDIFDACEQVRDAGYTKWDSCTPFAVHGLDKAMGLKPSPLPWIVLGGGLTGGISGLLFMIWVNVVAYPLNIGGKPLASIPAFIPVTFELTVLFSVFGAFFGLWALCRLPQLFHPAFASEAFAAVTDDKFAILIEADDPKFDEKKTRTLLEQTGAVLVEELED